MGFRADMENDFEHDIRDSEDTRDITDLLEQLKTEPDAGV